MKKLILVGLGIASCLQLSGQSFTEWVYDHLDPIHESLENFLQFWRK